LKGGVVLAKREVLTGIAERKVTRDLEKRKRAFSLGEKREERKQLCSIGT